MRAIDKNKLSQLQHLKREIEMLKNQIDNMDYTIASDSVKGSASSFPYVEHKIIITGIDVKGHDQKVDNLRRKLSRRVDELMDLVCEINVYIEGVNDSEMRQILTLRHVNGFTWRQVAAHIGGGNTEDSVRKAHDRFLLRQ